MEDMKIEIEDFITEFQTDNIKIIKKKLQDHRIRQY